jgi:hypothetical protein
VAAKWFDRRLLRDGVDFTEEGLGTFVGFVGKIWTVGAVQHGVAADDRSQLNPKTLGGQRP